MYIHTLVTKILHCLKLKYKESNLQDEPPCSNVTILQTGFLTCTWNVSPWIGEVWVGAWFTNRFKGQYTFFMPYMQLTFIKYVCSDTEILMPLGRSNLTPLVSSEISFPPCDQDCLSKLCPHPLPSLS